MNLPQVDFADYGFSKQNKLFQKTCNRFNTKKGCSEYLRYITYSIHKRKEKGAGVAAQRSRLPLPVTNEQKNSA